MQKYVGRITENRRGEQHYYSYVVTHRIDEKGKLVSIEDNGVLSDLIIDIERRGNVTDAERENINKCLQKYYGNTIILYNNYRNENASLNQMKEKRFFWQIEDLCDELIFTDYGGRIRTTRDFTASTVETLELEFFRNNRVGIGSETEIKEYYFKRMLRMAYLQCKIRMNEYNNSDADHDMSHLYEMLKEVIPDYKDTNGDNADYSIFTDESISLDFEDEQSSAEPVSEADTNRMNTENDNEDVHHYDDGLSQAFYLVKYGYAYGFLYYKMYSDLLENSYFNLGSSSNINVLSIGCGTKNDLFGLKLAVAEKNSKNNSNYSVYYHGVDINDWTTDEYCMFPSDGCFEQIDAIKYTSQNGLNHNVIIFPYSMNEMVDYGIKDLWMTICRNIAQNIKSDRVFIMTNIRVDNVKHGFQHDMKSSEYIKRQMTGHGFKCDSDTICIRGKKVDHQINPDTGNYSFSVNGVDFPYDLEYINSKYIGNINSDNSGRAFVSGYTEGLNEIRDYLDAKSGEINEYARENRVNILSIKMMSNIKYINYRIMEFVRTEE